MAAVFQASSFQFPYSIKIRLLLFVVIAQLFLCKVQAQCVPAPPAPGVQSPVLYCQNAVAVPLTATGTNLTWGNTSLGTAGGTSVLNSASYIDNNWNNRKLNFTTLKPNVTISTIDYYIPAYQAVLGLRISIYNNAGTIIASSSTTTSTSAGAATVKITNSFNYNIVTPGNYSIGVSSGMGNIGADNPSYPLTESSGTINITGGASSGLRCFNNIKFLSSATTVAPTPATDVPGSFTYTVSQTVAGCVSAASTITVIVTAAPVATISYTGNSFCSSQAGNIGVNRTGTSGGIYSSAPGLAINQSTGAITPGLSTPGVYTVYYTMAATGGCAAQVATSTVTINAAPQVTINKTETCVGSSTGTITAVATGGIGPYTYRLNGAAYQSSGVFTGLAAGNYTVDVMGNTGCVTSQVVTITQPSTATEDQTAAAANSWIGHMYDGTGFNNYIGQFTKPETFNETFGAAAALCFDVVSNAATRSVYTETFSVKFRMNSTKKGLYTANLGSDDGARLSVDGNMIFNNWNDHSFNLNSNVLMSLTGNSNLLYEYYENAADNRVVFENFTSLITNVLNANTTQNICIGNAALPISGDVYAPLPAGISLSGTGYQWVYSSSPAGTRVNIAGATGAAYTPSTAVAPFNTAGTYYIYRVARLSSSNNISPNPYVAGNESNAAVIVVSGGGQWNGSVSSDWALGANWCTGVAPSLATDVVIKSGAVRMPEVISNANCRSLTIEAGATVTTLPGSTINIAGIVTNNGTMSNSGTVNFNGVTQQTFSGINNFYNLTINNAAGVVLPSTITVNNNLLLASGILNANNNGILINGNWTNNASANSFVAGAATVAFTGTAAQFIGGNFATRFNNLTVNNTGNTVSLNVNAAIQNNLTVSAGSLDLKNFTANRETAGGTLTVANNAVLKIGGANTYPANFTNNVLIVASTVEYNGTNQTVANQTYGNLLLSSAAGVAVKTLPATDMHIVGNLISVQGSGTAVNYTAAANITVSGNVNIGASTTFNGAAFSQYIGGNWVNEGSFNGNTGTVIFNGTGATISGAGLQHFNNITISASLISFSNNEVTLSGNLATNSSGSFSLPAGGTLTMTGTNKTISGFGISVDNLVINGIVSTSSSLTVTGNLSVEGSFVSSSTSVITLAGNNKNITGAGAKSFASLYVTGSITTNSDFTIASALNISGTFTATAGTVTFINTSTLTGEARLFNSRINGTALRLSSGSVLGVAAALTISSGFLDVTTSTPNTVNFNGTGNQLINAITYNNLILSNGNIKTAAAGLAVNNNITIAASTSFASGNYTHSIYGNWYNNGIFTAANGTVQFMGSQHTGIYGATSFNYLTVNNATAATSIILHSNVSAAVINMISGTMLTQANTITITDTRTGNGIIMGNINRTHAFTNGIAYAFEGPNNTIQFTSVTGVSSITVSVSQQSITDFPYNAAIGRLYNINIPAGSYNASLKLHYEDAELNGNNESSIVLWNYNGTYWLPFGKASYSITDNYVEQSNITNLNNRWTCGYTSNVAEWSGAINNDWHVAGNWTILQGAPSIPPMADDVAVIGYAGFNHQPTISTAVTVKNIVFGSTKAVALSMAAGGTLNTGDIVGIWNAGNATHALNVNNQTINIAGNLALSDGANNHLINLNIGTGALNISGSLWQSGGADVVFTGAGNLSIRDDYHYINGSFVKGMGTVTYNGSVNQAVAAVSYHNLTINKTASTAFIHDSTHISGQLSLLSGELETRASTVISGNVNIAGGSVFDNYSTLRVGGHWNNNGTYTSGATGTNVIFNGAGNQHIASTTFHDLEINKPVGSVATLTGDVILKGDLIGTSGTLDIQSFFFNRDIVGGSARIYDNGTLIIASNNAPNKFSNYSLGTGSTVVFNGTGTQHLLLPGIAYGNLVFSNTGSKVLYTPITVNGNLTIETGARFDAGANTITLNGNWVNNGTYLPSTSTLLCTGDLKTISGNNSFNRLTVSGSYTMLHNNTINELLRITSTGNINGGANIITTMNGDLINNGILYTLGTTTFTGNVKQTLSLINAVQTVAITVNFNGSVPPVLNSTSAPQYGYLNINNTGGLHASVGYNILYGITVGQGAAFNAGSSIHNIYGYLNNSGTITSSGTLNFLPENATTLNLGTNFTSSGRVFFGGTGEITINGSPNSFRNISISNTNAAGVHNHSNWNLTHTLAINDGSILNAGNQQYNIGANIDNRGVINSGTSLFKLNGSIAQSIFSLSPFYNMQVENVMQPVSLLSDVTVQHELGFIKGNIHTENYKLVQPAEGFISNASQSTGWVNGNLKKEIASGAVQRVFETGDAATYAPVSLQLQNVTTGGNLTVRTTGADHPYLSLSRINVNKSVNRYWSMHNEGLISDSGEVTFSHTVAEVDAAASASDFGAGIYTNSGWAVVPTIQSDDSSTTVKSIQLSGDFAIGEVCNKNTAIRYNANHYCATSAPVVPELSGELGGMFSAAPGLVIDPSTGVVNPSASTPGEYKILYSLASTGDCASFTASTVIFIDPAPAATFAYANGPFCSGGAGIVPAFSGTSGGVFSADQGLYIDPFTGRIELGNNAPGNYTVNYNIASYGGCASASFTTNLSIKSPGEWLGTVSNNWFDAANWMCAVIPNRTSAIKLEAGLANYPLIDSAAVSFGNLDVAEGASMQIKNTTVSISGKITNAGIIDVAEGGLEFTGTVAQTLAAGTLYKNAVASLYISNSSDSGLVLAGPLDVYDLLHFTAAGNHFTTNDFLTLKSTSKKTARVGNMTGKTVAGNVMVENYIVPHKAWRFLSVPTNGLQTVNQSWQESSATPGQNNNPGFGTQISGGGLWEQNGFDYYTAAPAIKKYSTVTNAWVALPNTHSTVIKNTEGYMLFVRGDRSVNANLSSVTPTVLRTKGPLYSGNLPAIVVPAGKIMSVGNPYVSPIDLRKLSKTGLKDFFYLWDPLLGGQNGVGGYQVLSADSVGNYIITPGGGSYGAAGSVWNYIPTGQAFFVEAGTGNGTLSFTEHSKYAPGEDMTAEEPAAKITISLMVAKNDSTATLVDGLLINFKNSFSNSVDNGDAIKYANAGENISTLTAAKSFIVERRNLNNNKDTVYLKVTNLKAQQYKLILNTAQLNAEGRYARLIDNFSGTSTALQLNGSTQVHFTVTAAAGSYASNRFKIVFDKMTVLPVKYVSVKAYATSNKTINIDWQTAEEMNTLRYEIERSGDGRNFTKIMSATAKNIAAAQYSLTDTQPLEEGNFYRIKGIETSGEIIYSNIVKVALANNKESIVSVFPNPVTDGKTSLQLKNMPKAIYAVQLLNTSGQVVYSTSVENTLGSSTHSIDFGKTLTAGVYQLVTISADAIKRTTTVNIQ